MKKTMLIILAVALSVSFAFTMAFAGNLEQGTLSGTHYNLNLLGKKTCSGDDLVGSNRHTIQVLLKYSDPDYDNILGDDPGNYVTLDKRNKIFLSGGDDFQVTDGNACDNGAYFTLPWAVATEWTIYVRELGKPGKEGQPAEGDIRTCGISAGEDGIAGNGDDEIVCSTFNVPLQRSKGKPVFRNVTQELTTIDYYILQDDGSLVHDTAVLFDADFYQYFWDYDNNGLRLVQLRFYPVQ
jgi:hypothetical protein